MEFIQDLWGSIKGCIKVPENKISLKQMQASRGSEINLKTGERCFFVPEVLLVKKK